MAAARRRELLLILLLAAGPARRPRPGLGARAAPRARATGPHSTCRCASRPGAPGRRGEVPSWNASSFSGTPAPGLLPPRGAPPPHAGALAPLAPLTAFQLLVLVSLGLSGALAYPYARRLGAEPVGAFVAGLGFALGPYLVAHLGDTATVVAAPALPLVLLAAEAHLARPRRPPPPRPWRSPSRCSSSPARRRPRARGARPGRRGVLAAFAAPPGCRRGTGRDAGRIWGLAAAVVAGRAPRRSAARSRRSSPSAPAGPGGAGAAGPDGPAVAGITGLVRALRLPHAGPRLRPRRGAPPRRSARVARRLPPRRSG